MLVTNLNDHAVTLHSHCGNSVQVGAKARRVPVANKFAWQVPARVILEETDAHEPIDPTTTVRGKPVAPLARAPKTAEEARKFAAKGLHPHQTPAGRREMAEIAKKILSETAPKGDVSGEALVRASTPIPESTDSPRLDESSDAPHDDHPEQ